MKLKNIENTLNKYHKKLKPLSSDVEKFVANLNSYFKKLDETESEENAKINLINFLNSTFYQDNYYVNTKKRADLVIHTDNTTKSNVGVIIETKRINSPDLPTLDNLNTKAFHQLILYYLRERIEHNNINIKNLIITDFYKWFIFDANFFEKSFFQNKSLLKNYEQWKNNQKVRTDTDLFYNDIAKPIVENLQNEIEFTFFDLNNYKEVTDKAKIINLYKIFSPVFLLNEKQKNDNNTLNSKFYNELLHIIGIQETKEGNKKVIRLKDTGDGGSLIENTIRKLKIHNNLKIIPTIEQYGETLNERLFGIALELCINWLNRILFLKLLEAQIVKYHNQKKEYFFLTSEKITQFEQLDRLFFEVLAVKRQDRDAIYKGFFEYIPYLNSSLFEPTDIERHTIYIDSLYNDLQLQVFGSTILKDSFGNKLYTKLPTLKYLLDFLNAYSFSSDSSELTINFSNTLINSSVLGLIFEKLNGYKDGAYFTPSYITMYMCRETIRKAIVNKFKPLLKLSSNLDNSESWTELFNKIDNIPIKKANEIINSITICDPAVGSGHFLVSALNELISVKSDLKILCDSEGKRLKNYHINNINDELVVRDEDNKEFEYTLTNDNKINPEKQRIQETLFNEKKQIIENCLFGVDINPNSVNITRLRLWIELLKNAYYTADSNYTELHTLPNIDINIKQGNSLLSKFPINADLKKALRGTKWNLFTYVNAVNTYKKPIDKEAKKQIAELINDIKQKFKSGISVQDPRYKKLQKLKSELYNKTTVKLLDVELEEEDRAKETQLLLDYEAKIKKIETELEEERTGVAYQNAFEWRFEFPEVLDDNGEFVGFDVIIGNPPYMIMTKNNTNTTLLNHYTKEFDSIKKSYSKNIFTLFIEAGIKINKTNANLSYIVPEGLFNTRSYKDCVDYIYSKGKVDEIVTFQDFVFEEAVTGNLIFSFKNGNFDNGTIFKHYNNNEFTEIKKENNSIIEYIQKSDYQKLGNICLLFKGMVVKDRKTVLKEKKDKINNDEFLLGNCISKWSIDNQYYTDYNNLEIIGGTKVKSKHDINPRVLIRRTGDNLCCAFLTRPALTESTLYSCSSKSENIDNKYILGLLNSDLLTYYIQETMITNKQAFPQILMTDLQEVPIPVISKSSQKKIITLVDKILDSKKDTDNTLQKLNAYVYKIYSLTYEQILMINNRFQISADEYNKIKI